MQRDLLALYPLLSLIHSHSPEATMGLDRRCVSSVASQMSPGACVPTQIAEPEGWTCSHHPARSGLLWNPAWTILERQSAWEECSGTIKAVSLPFLIQDALLSPLQNPHGRSAAMQGPGPA